jgi:hypothetical protein
MTKSGKIFLVCAIGAILGLLISLAVPQIIWWVGVLAGGFIGWFAGALPDIIRQTPEVTRTTWQGLKYLPKIANALVSFFQNIKSWPRVKKWQTIIIIIEFLILSLCILLPVTLLSEKSGSSIAISLSFYVIYTELIFVFFMVWSHIETKENDKIKKIQMGILSFTVIFFLGMMFWLLVKLFPKIWNGGRKIIIEIFKFLWRFSKRLFILVHSRELALVALDSALAVIISYLVLIRLLNLPLGPALVCAGLLGGLIGLLDYQIVSRKILKIVPQPVR